MGDHTYHKSCAKCETCKGQLNIQNFATSGNRLLCKTHFMEEFHSSGGTYGGDDKFKHASRGNDKKDGEKKPASTTKAVNPVAEPKVEAVATVAAPVAPSSGGAAPVTAPDAAPMKKMSVAERAKAANSKATSPPSSSTGQSKPKGKKTFSFGGPSKSNKCPKCNKTVSIF
jgi:hypothetical protein